MIQRHDDHDQTAQRIDRIKPGANSSGTWGI
jgi:hypothetical protein